jgi:phosphate transport system substrate-binding protein
MSARRLILVVLAVVVGSIVMSHAGSRDAPPAGIQLREAGSTFAAPLYKKWIDTYQPRHPETLVSYEAIGSGEGIQKFLTGAVDFGASDAAMTDAEMAAVSRGVQLVPAVAGSIVLAYQLEGLGGPLTLTREVYVDIFLGRIQTWNDPRLQRINPGLTLPQR